MIHPSSFTDMSCASATTANMTRSQSVPGGGTNPPQFGALSSADRLVTEGIGGNDADLIGVAETCALEERLNSVLSRRASGNRATYVDTFTSSIGHDACKPPGVAWVNGIIPNSVAYPLHPNQAGEQNMANRVLVALW